MRWRPAGGRRKLPREGETRGADDGLSHRTDRTEGTSMVLQRLQRHRSRPPLLSDEARWLLRGVPRPVPHSRAAGSHRAQQVARTVVLLSTGFPRPVSTPTRLNASTPTGHGDPDLDEPDSVNADAGRTRVRQRARSGTARVPPSTLARAQDRPLVRIRAVRAFSAWRLRRLGA